MKLSLTLRIGPICTSLFSIMPLQKIEKKTRPVTGTG